jgi:hypothetical protein
MSWLLLVYKIPSRPSRLRLQVWRKLQRLGALYLQDAVCALPDQAELEENFHYLAQSIQEMGGQCFIFRADTLSSKSQEQMLAGFEQQADERLDEISQRLAQVDLADDPERAEESLKNERIAFLRANRLNYFGSNREKIVEAQLEELKEALNRANHPQARSKS